jgi:hypothetical protein
VLGEDELALLTRRFVNSRRNSRTCFKCGKTRHFFTECPKVNNHTKHKSKDKGRRSKNEHEHRRKTRTREKIKRLNDVDSALRTRHQARVKKKRVTRRRKRRTLAST